jgi:hypothetical protein
MPSVLAGIGEMVVDDLGLILRGLPPQRLQAARPGDGIALAQSARTQLCSRNHTVRHI